MGTERQRSLNLKKILNTIQSASAKGKGIDKKKIIAEVCIEQGLTRRKAEEYISLLLDAERIIEKEEGLFYNDI